MELTHKPIEHAVHAIKHASHALPNRDRAGRRFIEMDVH
jgi:hypothetical protein